MGRMIASVVLGLLLFTYALYHFGLVGTNPPVKPPILSQPKLDVGDFLYTPKSLPAEDERLLNQARDADPIQFPGVMQVMDKQEVSSQVEGQLLWLGEEISPAAQIVAGAAPFLVDPPDPYYLVPLKYQEVIMVKAVDGTMKAQYVNRQTTRIYKRLMKGQTVQRDQMLAQLNPVRAFSERRSKEFKLDFAEAERVAAEYTEKEAKAQYEKAQDLKRRSAIAEYDFRIAFLTWIRHFQEFRGKENAVKSAGADLEQAKLILGQHEIPNKLSAQVGVIKEIYRDRGEAVKPGDKIMDLYSLDRFIAEGQLEAPHLHDRGGKALGARVRPGTKITIEPSQEEPPVRTLRGHRGEITSVAFTKEMLSPITKDKTSLLVSASEDKSVLVWDRRLTEPVYYLRHPDPVRMVVCSPAGASHNLILAGCSDGSIYVWNLDTLPNRDHPENELQKLPDKDKETAHRDAITALAFSPDGKYVASGSADAVIQLWDFDSRKLLYAFDPEHGAANPHQGSITALHFTPQCRLVSASRDNTLRVWSLHKSGVAADSFPIEGRSGGVNQLGVTSDGRYMLFDQGKTLQVLSVADGLPINTLQNPGGSILFETLATFSPDASLLLTAGAPEGRLQLWSTPTRKNRGFEVRQLVAKDRSPVTCAAFAPTSQALAASGTKDGNVYLWPIPSPAEVQNHCIRDVPVTAILLNEDPATRQVQIRAVVNNQYSPQYPNGRLIPGRPVTMVIE